MKQSEMIKLLKQNGFQIKREGKEHTIYWNPETKQEVQLPRSKKELRTGTANRIILVVLFSIILLLNKNHIKIGTIICVIGVGPIIDLGIRVVSVLPVESYSYLLKMFLIALGCFIIAIGFSILSATKVGVAPNDIIPFIIKERINCEYRWIRICMDAFLLIGGFMLGGTVGVGTIIAMATTGPFIQLCLPYGQKFTDFILINKDESQEELSMNTF